MASKRTITTKHPAPAAVIPAERLDAAQIQQTLAALAAMGDGEVAYMRSFRADEMQHLFPQAAELHPAMQLHALFAADGTPLVLSDSREAVLSGAWQNELSMISVH